VKLRCFGPAVNSADATTGAATTQPTDDGVAGPSGEEGNEEGRRSGITMGSISCALERKLQTVKCLTLVGTEGDRHSHGSSMLTALRLPSFHKLWAEIATRADTEGWPAARFLAVLAEYQLAERDMRRLQRAI